MPSILGTNMRSITARQIVEYQCDSQVHVRHDLVVHRVIFMTATNFSYTINCNSKKMKVRLFMIVQGRVIIIL